MSIKTFVFWGAAIAAFLFFFLKRKQVSQVVQTTLSNMSNDKHISNLHPSIREKVRALIVNAAKKNIVLKITSSVRTMQEQATLYAQGRTSPGQKVTNAKPGSSYHNFCLALDVVEIRNGKAIWDNERWNEIGAIGKALGLRWGGDWKTIVDKPHFEAGPSLAVLNAKYNANLIDDQGFIKNLG